MAVSSMRLVASLFIVPIVFAACSSEETPAPPADTGTPSDTSVSDSATDSAADAPSDTSGDAATDAATDAADAGGDVGDAGGDVATDAAGDAADATADGGDAKSGGAKAHIRVAHLSPDAPAVKVCVTAKSATFSAADQPMTPALAYKSVSIYLDVEPGEYKTRLVGDAALDCSTPLANLPDVELPPIPANGYKTAAAIGKIADAGKPTAFQVTSYLDTLDTPAPGTVNLKLFHAAPTTPGPLFVGFASVDCTSVETALFSNASFGKSDPTNGYKSIATSTTKATLAASINANANLVWFSRTLSANGLPDQAIRTLFAIDAAGATAPGQIDIMMCDDTDQGTEGLNKSCVVLPKG